jgi:hypothetical protein
MGWGRSGHYLIIGSGLSAARDSSCFRLRLLTPPGIDTASPYPPHLRLSTGPAHKARRGGAHQSAVFPHQVTIDANEPKHSRRKIVFAFRNDRLRGDFVTAFTGRLAS